MFKYYRTIPYGRRSIYIDKWGEVAHEPTRDIIFVDDSTGEIFISNDLKIKIYKRNKKIKAFYEFYNHYFKKKLVSIVLYVVNVKCISSISNQLKSIRKKLKRSKYNCLQTIGKGILVKKNLNHIFILCWLYLGLILNSLINCLKEIMRVELKQNFAMTFRSLQNI
jgi:hypothetical protein